MMKGVDVQVKIGDRIKVKDWGYSWGGYKEVFDHFKISREKEGLDYRDEGCKGLQSKNPVRIVSDGISGWFRFQNWEDPEVYNVVGVCDDIHCRYRSIIIIYSSTYDEVYTVGRHKGNIKVVGPIDIFSDDIFTL